MRYVSVVLPFRDLDFNLLSQLESQKDAKAQGWCNIHCTSISDATPFLVDPLSSENLIGEASTSEVPETVGVTTTLSISVTAASASSIPPISTADYDKLDAGIQGEVPHSPNIGFENETLETTPERPTTS
ncbi:hypothetical protein Tco_0875468 [Tanacetum coccineum]|uniref:Uncharacterized protein n=1 Tax=Tanacetum coccineum TaxID=301880 RepID=A0ABQ5BSC1_9ASTR